MVHLSLEKNWQLTSRSSHDHIIDSNKDRLVERNRRTSGIIAMLYYSIIENILRTYDLVFADLEQVINRHQVQCGKSTYPKLALQKIMFANELLTKVQIFENQLIQTLLSPKK